MAVTVGRNGLVTLPKLMGRYGFEVVADLLLF